MENNFRKNIQYYFCFLLLFFIVHVFIYSTVSFFHFLLGHDMSTIESWISRNHWDVLVLSKVIALALCWKALHLNLTGSASFWDILKGHLDYPSIKICLTSVFLLGTTLMLGGYFSNANVFELGKEGFNASIFLGSGLFFFIDFLFLFVLRQVYVVQDESKVRLWLLFVLMFGLFTKLAIPYLGYYLIVALLHFISLLIIGSPNKLSDAALYCLVIVAPLNAFFGMNLVAGWGQSYGVIYFFGLVVAWIVGLVYYRLSLLN